MDIYCPKCGEPWGIDSLHDRVSELHPDMPWVVQDKPERVSGHNDPFWYTYPQAYGGEINSNAEIAGWYDPAKYQEFYQPIYKDFRSRGCIALGASCYAPNVNPAKNAVYGALMEFAGDDIDFAASMMDEAQSWGLFGDEFDD